MATDDERKRRRSRVPGSVRSKLEGGEAKQLKAVLPTERWKRLKIAAVLEDRTLNDAVNEAIEDWLKRHERK